MGLPDFTEDGILPPGLHLATLEDVVRRFGEPSLQRQAIAESLAWAIRAARRAGVVRFVVDGSFVDAKSDPNDVDCVLLLAEDYPRDRAAAREIEEGFPYVEMIFFEVAADFERFLRRQFETDRLGRQRGLVEIDL